MQIEQYTLTSHLLGKGNFSKVYKGLNTQTDQVVAIKIVEKDTLKQIALDNLKTEVALMTEFDHENIVKMYECIDDGPNYYLVMEYCSGGDLAVLLAQKPLSIDVARDYASQLARALNYLRSKNIVHRDIKPKNIVLTADRSTIKLTDFNFARTLYETDMTKTSCGTPLWMAPEIIEVQEYTSKTDLWSTGLVIYEMVYGRNPFSTAVNPVDLLNMIKKDAIPYNKNVDPQCNDLLQGLLKVNPLARYCWEEFFTHQWLDLNEPAFLDNISDIDFKTTSSEKVTKSAPIPIKTKGINVIPDYIPISPPKNARSDYFTTPHYTPPKQTSTSAPNLWKLMNSSLNTLKGAFK